VILAATLVGLLSAAQGRLQAGRSYEPSMPPHPAIETVPGELLVRYRMPSMPIEIGQASDRSILAQRQQALTTEASRLSQAMPIEVVASYPLVGMQRLTVTSGASVPEVIAQLASDQAVELVEPNYKVYAFEASRSVEPNDLAWPTLWGMNKIQSPAAWVQTTGSDQVLVAVIDTGVDYTHRDLAPNIWTNPKEIHNGKDDDGNGIVDDVHGARFCGSEPSGDPRDDQGHGTHVAGTIAAAGDNRHDVVGVAWRVKVMALQFLCADGSGNTADAVRAIEYALLNGAQVINASWGSRARSRALEEAVREADRQGVLFVAAAGNEGMNNDMVPSFPASYPLPSVLAVTATDWNDNLADFSNFGQRSVSIAAPGVSILSTVPGDRLTFMNGTSMATPHVTGCAALLKARNPSLLAQGLKSVLLRTGDPIDALKGAVQGSLRMNCGKAVEQALRP
jgi:subtilisin family serine protease